MIKGSSALKKENSSASGMKSPHLTPVGEEFKDLDFEHKPQHSHEDDEPHEAKKEEGEGPWLVSYADMMTLLMGFFALIASFSKPDVKAFEEVKKSAAEKFGGKYNEPYKDLEDKINKAVAKEKQEGKIKVIRSAEGVTVMFDGTTFFDSGGFVVKSEGGELITKITTSLKSDIPTLKAIVEGHTDNVPIQHPIIASNWELSAIRAARIAEIMEVQGFTKSQLTIQGWGETKPVAPNLDAKGVDIPANQAKNRRVVIKVFREAK